MPTGVYVRTPKHIAQFKARMKKIHKKRKYTKRFARPDSGAIDGISVQGAIVLLKKAKRSMTMEDMTEKDLYVLLALQELQGTI